MPRPRPYQSEHVRTVITLHQTVQSVLGRGATGLGKAVELAMLAQHYVQYGRVLVLVDVTKLVRQLAKTIAWFAGISAGIEMADSKARNGGYLVGGKDDVIVSTVQTQYSGAEGEERYRQFDPMEFSALLLDECELFMAPAARAVVEWYKRGNPNLKIYGCTATPFRTDGVSMSGLFEAVAFDCDILWGIDNGWLVNARQAFVRVSVDFSTLKIRRDAEGDKDYSDEQIAEKITNEETLVELAKGIRHVAGSRRSIICCPSVASAKAVAHYLEAEQAGCARVVYGEMSDEAKEEVMEAHKNGEFQFLSSVMMLTKGYDDPGVEAVFNCRKTRSKRLYQQILGRGTRPPAGLLDELDLETPEVRRDAIAACPKPNMLMVNMVGVDDEIRDITIADILGGKVRPEVLDRAKANMLAEDGEQDLQEALDNAEHELAEEEAEAEKARQARARRLQLEQEDRERRRRMRLQVDAEVEVEYEDDLRVGGITGIAGDIAPKHVNIFRKFKWPDAVVARMTPEQARSECGRLIGRAKRRLVTSWKVGTLLRRKGFTKEQIAGMTQREASAIIDYMKNHNWQPPPAQSEAAA